MAGQVGVRRKKMISTTSLSWMGMESICRNHFRKMGVGFELIPWLLGDGRKFFIKHCLEPLGEEFLFWKHRNDIKKSIH